MYDLGRPWWAGTLLSLAVSAALCGRLPAQEDGDDLDLLIPDLEKKVPKAAPPPPRRRPLDHEHPFYSFHMYSDGVLAHWKNIPPELRPYAGLRSRLLKGQDDLIEAGKNGIPLLVNMSRGHDGAEDKLMKAHPCIVGLLGEEFGYGWASSRSMPYGVKTCRDRGAYLFWTFLDNFNRFIDGSGRQFRLSTHERMYDFIKENGKWFVFEVKANGTRYQDKKRDWEAFGEFIKGTEIVCGSWLTGLVENFGYQPEDWISYEKGYSRLYEYSEPYDRGRWGVDLHGINNNMTPENLIAMEVLLSSIHGCTMYTFEIGLGAGERPSVWHEFAVMPALIEVATRKLIPSREDMMKRVRVASYGSFRELYATTSCVLQNNGRYSLIPWLPKYTPDEELRKFEVLPGDYDYRDYPFLNALYPQESRGRAFIERQGKHWYVMNPYENIKRDGDFEFDLYANTCKSLAGTIKPHGYAIVEEAPDRLDVFLNNFRLDKTILWDHRHAYLPIGWLVEGDVGGRIKQWAYGQVLNTRLRQLRTDSFVLVGHTGTAKPELTIEGHDGFKYEERWDKTKQRYELDIAHNGIVRFTLKAAGETQTGPPRGLSGNLAMDKKATAGSARDKCAAALATDGLYHTYWAAAGSGPQWLAVDLGREVEITAYKVAHGMGTNTPAAAFKFQTAPAAGGPWTTVHEARSEGERVRAYAVDRPVKSRHVRLLFDSPPGSCLVREFGVYTGPAGELKKWAPIAESADMKAILALLPGASTDADRIAIEHALTAAWRRADDREPGLNLLLEAFKGLDEREAACVPRVLGRMASGKKILQALRRLEKDERHEVSQAARWALVYWAAGTGPIYSPGPAEHPFRLSSPEENAPPPSDWSRGREVLDDLRRIAGSAPDLSLRSHALRAILGTIETGTLDDELVHDLCCEGLRLATERRNKQRFLGHIHKHVSVEALRAVAPRMEDEDSPKLKGWARSTCVAMAARVWKEHPVEVASLLGPMLENYRGPRDTELRDRIKALLREMGKADRTAPPAPRKVTAVAKSTASIQLTWPALSMAADPESAIAEYRVYRVQDGKPVECARLVDPAGSVPGGRIHIMDGDRPVRLAWKPLPDVTWGDGGLPDGTEYGYQVSAVNYGGLEGPRSEPVRVRTHSDRRPPQVRGVIGSTHLNKVYAWFNKPVDPKSAVITGNYRFDAGRKITAAGLGDTAKTVVLTVPGLKGAKELKLHVANVRDRATKPNTMAAQTCRFKPVSVLPGLRYAEYNGRPHEWDVAAFKAMEPRSERVVSGFDLAIVEPGPGAVLRYVGAVFAPVRGQYVFGLKTRRDSKLYIDGKPLVTGGHRTLEFSGGVELEPGVHSIAVIYQHDAESGGLSVRWQGPGFAREPVPADALFHFDEAARALREMEAGLDPARRKPAAPPSADIEDDIDLDLGEAIGEDQSLSSHRAPQASTSLAVS